MVFPVCRWLSRCRCRLCTSRGLSTHCLPSSSRSSGHVACGCPKTWPSHRQIAGTIWETAKGVPLKYIAVYSTVPQWNSTWMDRNTLRGSLKVSLGSSLYFSATVVPAWQTVPLGLWTYQGNKWNNVVSWIYRRTQVPVGMTNECGRMVSLKWISLCSYWLCRKIWYRIPICKGPQVFPCACRSHHIHMDHHGIRAKQLEGQSKTVIKIELFMVISQNYGYLLKPSDHFFGQKNGNLLGKLQALDWTAVRGLVWVLHEIILQLNAGDTGLAPMGFWWVSSEQQESLQSGDHFLDRLNGLACFTTKNGVSLPTTSGWPLNFAWW